MKRILPTAFALAFAAFLSGCGDRNDTNRPAGTGATGTPATPSSPATPAEKPDQSKRGTQSPAKP